MTSIGPRPGPASLLRWELWTLRPGLRTYALAVEATAVGVTIALLSHAHIQLADLLMLAAIVALGLAKEELTRNVERMRPRRHRSPARRGCLSARWLA